MENNLSYSVIPKGRGFLYARDSQLYMHVKTQGNIKYLKCIHTGCDGSMKLVDDEIIRWVRKHPLNLCTFFLVCISVTLQTLFFHPISSYPISWSIDHPC